MRWFLAFLPALAAGQTLLYDQTIKAAPNGAALARLKGLASYSLVLSADSLLTASATEAPVSLRCDGTTIATKILHAGDPDWTTSFAVPKACQLQVVASVPAQITLHELGETRHLELEPNNTWSQATRYQLGSVLFASGDDSAYLPPPSHKRGKPEQEFVPADEDWYRFRFDGPAPKLVHFQIDLTERDNLPVDISVFRVVGGKPVLYTEGEDPVSVPHEVQALPGNKFTTRVFREAGDYYLRVVAHHPEYRLRSRIYGAAPYQDPREAVRTGIDYLMGAGDSWHANTPRRGGIFDRVANVHQETSLCVACHVTHFTQRAQLYALRQGYGVEWRSSLRFMTERFYNNPRPLYGFESQGAVWARVISAPANVLGRMGHLMNVFETQVTREPRESFHDGIRSYLKLYYDGRTQLPPDETNGNQPLVSNYEVAWYAWEETHDPAIARLLEQDDHKNLIDLCYQTQALAAIDRQKYKDKIQRNAERLLSLQRPSGQWSMKFDPKEKEVEFQTGHVLWALAAAGIPKENPQVAKGLAYLLGRQQEFGGWLDPLQSFENFRTPMRETQMAVLALSAYYPAGPAVKGWQSTATAIGSGEQALLDLDRVWDEPSSAVLGRIRLLTQSKEPFLRQAAVEALGRLAKPEDLTLLARLLDDRSKLTQRTAAWAVRQILSRHPGRISGQMEPLEGALASTSPRLEWGATRVFATHFRELAREPRLADALIAKTASRSIAVQIQAWKGLWQFWFWSADQSVKSRIEDAFLAAIQKPQPDWVERNLREGIYNLADENIRYLYNNWVPLLPRKEDQDRVIRGRLAIESRLAEKFSRVLDQGNIDTRKRLLAALTEFHLRRADTYDLKSDPHSVAAPIYSRIGNDIEQIVFFGESNSRFAKSLQPLITAGDPELRRLATEAALLTRDVRFAGVTAISGAPGKERDALVSEALKDPGNETNLELLKAFNQAPKPKFNPQQAAVRARTTDRPDESYFRGYVQPILEKRGKDGYACVQCHASHAIFDGTWATAMKVVNLENVEDSLILKKPTSSAETEGVAGSKATAHGGGVRFEKDSPEYNTILNWIRGAKP